MSPVNEKWSAEPDVTFEDTEDYTPKEVWETDLPTDVPAYHKRRTAGLWTALATLAVALAVVAIYGYSVMSKVDAKLSWLPGMVSSLSGVRDRVADLETGLQAWQKRQENLAAEVQKLDATWKSRLNDTRAEVANLVHSTYNKQQEELNQRTAALNAQITQMASRQLTEQVHVAQLEKELARTQMELASVKENYARELAVLRDKQSANQHAIASIDNVISTDRADFEIQKNQTVEIVPGIALQLTKTDTQHQRYQGWISLMANGNTIRVRGQSVQQPFVFYPGHSSEAYELVVTRVSQKKVTGYLLIPRKADTQQAALVSGKKPVAEGGRASF